MQRKLLMSCLTIAAAMLMGTTDANAGWWGSHGGSWGGSSHGGSSGGASSGGSWGSSGGYVASYGSRGGSWGGSSGGSSGGYSSGGSWGSSHGSSGGGLFARWHARRAARAWCHSSGGSYGASYGSHGSSGGSWGSSHGSSYGVPYQYSTPVESAPMEYGAPTEATPALPPAASLDRNSGGLVVKVPAEAKIFVNGQATTSTGSLREYISRDLKAGYQYDYEVRAEVMRDGKLVSATKNVSLEAGRLQQISFDFEEETVAAKEPVETVLTLKVPEDAKVTLAGNATTSAGSEREFRTTGLTAGQVWENYNVVVTVERDGRTLTKQQTIALEGGQSVDLSFDFDTSTVAAR